MSAYEPQRLADYDEWAGICRNRGDEGPYSISGSQGMRAQFVRKDTGTSAIWNHDAGWGYVFPIRPS